MAGTIVADTLQDGAGNSTAMDNAIYGSAKAWVNFNGNGATSIRASYNVSSVTYSGTGYYTVNITNAFADANYVVTGSARSTSGYATTSVTLFQNGAGTPIAPTTSAFAVSTAQQGVNNGSNSDYVCITVFR
jgi:hypothetical protein